MGKPWLILTRRYGGAEREPTSDALALAIRELYVEDAPGMTEADYEEHGAAFLRRGFDDGPVLVLHVTRGETVRFEEYSDQDDDEPAAPALSMGSVPRERALELWKWLAAGEIEKVRGQPWSVGD